MRHLLAVIPRRDSLISRISPRDVTIFNCGSLKSWGSAWPVPSRPPLTQYYAADSPPCPLGDPLDHATTQSFESSPALARYFVASVAQDPGGSPPTTSDASTSYAASTHPPLRAPRPSSARPAAAHWAKPVRPVFSPPVLTTLFRPRVVRPRALPSATRR